VKPHIDSLLTRLKLSKIDLVMLPAREDVSWLAPLKEEKKAGRVRYIGVQVITDSLFPQVAAIMRNEPIDFVATDYSAAWRGAEVRILPLAQERKIAFMANFPFDRARLLKRASSTALPEWATEFDARTWPQFYLKYVLGHPAVTVVRTGTTKTAHLLDNLGGGIGRLPDEAMRKRMAELVDSIPEPPKQPAPAPSKGRITREQAQEQEAKLAPSVELSAAVLDRYVGQYEHVAAGTKVSVRRDGEKLLAKVHGESPDEMPFVARSETRFASVRFTLEFHLDGQGKVTGATWGPDGIPLERK
jgi:hypothetical protein